MFCPAGLSCALRKYIPSVAVRVGISAEPSPMGLPFAFPAGVACSEKVQARFSVDFVCGYGTSRYAGNCANQLYTLVMVDRTNDVS
ncbi:hypothetical protein FQZ97_1179370 [compost metagenome]